MEANKIFNNTQKNDFETTIKLIKERIKSEHRKHKDIDWEEIAARKIYSSLKKNINGEDLLFELMANQEEIISDPRRFNGVRIDTIKNIFLKHGIIYKEPF